MYACVDCKFDGHAECILISLSAINTSFEGIGDDLYNDIGDNFNPANAGGGGGGESVHEELELELEGTAGTSTSLGGSVTSSPSRPKEPKPSFKRPGVDLHIMKSEI